MSAANTSDALATARECLQMYMPAVAPPFPFRGSKFAAVPFVPRETDPIANHWMMSGLFKTRIHTLDLGGEIGVVERTTLTHEIDEERANELRLKAAGGSVEADLILRSAAMHLLGPAKVTDLRRRGTKLPPLLADYAAGPLRIPKGLRQRIDHAQRNLAVAVTVDQVMKRHGLGVHAAYAIVAEALAAHEVRARAAWTAIAVERAWKRHRDAEYKCVMTPSSAHIVAVACKV